MNYLTLSSQLGSKEDSVSALTMQINQLLAEPDRLTLDRALLALVSASLTNKAVTGTEQQVGIGIKQMGECIKSVTIHL
jgi:hypothetical protein